MNMGIRAIAITTIACLLGGSALAADVKTNWENHCVKCHGADGKGNTRMGRQSGVKDYTDPKVQEAMNDDKAVKIIKEGIVEKGKKKMDPYGDKLNDEEIKALIAHMRSFKK
jgi:cytochrome c553